MDEASHCCGIGEVDELWFTPNGESIAQMSDGALGIGVRECSAPASHEVAEPSNVERVAWLQAQAIPHFVFLR
ncbi:hypothetical protein GCM10029978_068080 [Actinoallomurus acanthiterrae]